jgi:glucose-1-phosphate adenylyltransferase
MGNYLFKTEVLIDLLESTTDDDFGGEVIPHALGSYRVHGYDFDGFWEDIGTIRSFYDTNLMLARPNPPFNLNEPQRPIFTRPRYLPGSIIDGATLHDVLLADGCHIQQAEIDGAIIGLRSQIANGVSIKNSILMGADYFDPPGESPPGGVPLGIGPGCQIEGAILDKNARLGAGVVIRPFPLGTELDEHDFIVRDGIVVIPKNTILPAGTHIEPE